jgi:hypothetical protein
MLCLENCFKSDPERFDDYCNYALPERQLRKRIKVAHETLTKGARLETFSFTNFAGTCNREHPDGL